MQEFQKARTNMVDCQIHTNGVISPAILNAFETLPREEFVPKEFKKIAYSDRPITLKDQRFLLDPMTHAKILESLNIKPDDVILEIGVGSGYGTGILSSLASTVIGVEEDAKLLKTAEKNLESLNIRNAVLLKHSLIEGADEHAPYEKIIINGASAEVPKALVSQLKDNGILIFIFKPNPQKIGVVMQVQKTGESKYSEKVLFETSAPYLPGFEGKEKFHL